MEQVQSILTAGRPPEKKPGSQSPERTRESSKEEAPFSYEILKDKNQRELLAERVAGLVEKAHGSKTDAMVFLDKSARPIALLFMRLWKGLHPDEQAPAIRFLNIGKELTDGIAEQLTVTPDDIREDGGTKKTERIKHALANLLEIRKACRQLAQGPLNEQENEKNEARFRNSTLAVKSLLRDYYADPENLDLDKLKVSRFMEDFSGVLIDPEIIEAMDEASIAEVLGGKSFRQMAESKGYVPNPFAEQVKMTVVDEYSHTGTSLALAKRFLQATNKGKGNLKIETTALSEKRDSLFFVDDQGGPHYNPPWRKTISEYGYGMTGVIDSEGVFAKPYYKIEEHAAETFDEFKAELAAELKRFYSEIAESPKVLRSYLDEIAQSASKALGTLEAATVKAKLKDIGLEYDVLLASDPILSKRETISKAEDLLRQPQRIVRPIIDVLGTAQMKKNDEVDDYFEAAKKECIRSGHPSKDVYRLYGDTPEVEALRAEYKNIDLEIKALYKMCHKAENLIKSIFKEHQGKYAFLRKTYDLSKVLPRPELGKMVRRLRAELDHVAEEYLAKDKDPRRPSS